MKCPNCGCDVEDEPDLYEDPFPPSEQGASRGASAFAASGGGGGGGDQGGGMPGIADAIVSALSAGGGPGRGVEPEMQMPGGGIPSRRLPIRG